METLPPAARLNELLTGYWHTQAIYVAAKLGLADQLGDGPRTSGQLATAVQVDPAALYRLLRALASIGIFREAADGRFELTPMAECLRDHRPGSMRALAIMSGEEHYRAWGELLYSVQTGKPAFDKIYGLPIFDFLAQHPEQAAIFDAAMVGVHGRETSAMLDAYDFSTIGTLADVGGGNGSLLMTVLRRHPSVRGILYDLPGVVERARPGIAAAGLAERCTVLAGNFFEQAPPGADAYLMRHILHDWDDDRAITILRNIRKVIRPDGKLLVIEGVIPPGNDPAFGKLLDLTMLVLPGGKERTADEYRVLFQAGGFELRQIVPTAAEVSVLEGRPVGS
jgi:ubiquinone/menaquinone biosynthesis C-methylase UbiE